jgi:hypothetical protein
VAGDFAAGLSALWRERRVKAFQRVPVAARATALSDPYRRPSYSKPSQRILTTTVRSRYWRRNNVPAAGRFSRTRHRWSSGGAAEERHDGQLPNRVASSPKRWQVVYGGVMPNFLHRPVAPPPSGNGSPFGDKLLQALHPAEAKREG